MSVRILHGDCIEVMRSMSDASVDSVVTDPPYGIGFMGKAWDGADIERRMAERRAAQSKDPHATERGSHKSAAAAAGLYDLSPAGMLAFQEFSEAWAREAMRVLKPGGYLLSFASTRTYHRMTCGIEAAGFEIRDQIGWVFGSGFPKSRNGAWGGTALKPAWEPICMARKPLAGTIMANWTLHGTGALNIDACRIEVTDAAYARNHSGDRGHDGTRDADEKGATDLRPGGGSASELGRWPANLAHDGSDEVLAAFPQTPGQKADLCGDEPSAGLRNVYEGTPVKRPPLERRGDAGSAARFFYCAKADRSDRNEGLQGMPKRRVVHQAQTLNNGSGTLRNGDGLPTETENHHPTVKPTDLMRWLVRLVTPAGGVVLDPFMGSGSTLKAAELEGFDAIGIELEAAYVEIAKRRVAADAPLFAEVIDA